MDQSPSQTDRNALQDVHPHRIIAIYNARLDNKSGLHTVRLHGNGRIESIDSQPERLSRYLDEIDSSINESTTHNADGGLLAPSLCHAHVHLDKCFLLQDPKYADLKIAKGSFNEAMELTHLAKDRFSVDDVLRRGRRLIRESLEAGVTSMRAFVELDECAQERPLQAVLQLKQECESICTVQVCAFAQLPLFREKGPNNETALCDGRQRLLEAALENSEVEAVGTTPYVEADRESMEQNVRWAIKLACKYHKHLDFHLDYNVDSRTTPLIHYVISELKRVDLVANSHPLTRITVGHCSRLTQFTDEEWHGLKIDIGSLPIAFVGLPTSDLFMMGRPTRTFASPADERPRGTLQIPRMIQHYYISGCISINNVNNAFTPWGNCDPLSLAHFGIGIYQSATLQDTEVLYQCVSTRAKACIGMPAQDPLGGPQWGDLVIFHPKSWYQPAPKSTSDLVYSPDTRRTVFFRGARIQFDS